MLRTSLIAAVLAIATGLGVVLQPMWQVQVPDMVTLRVAGRNLGVAVNEVSAAGWQACVDDGACEMVRPLPAAATKMPVTGVNWFDVNAYVLWLNRRSARKFRLPRLEEWMAFSGKTETPLRKPLFDDPRMAWAASYGQDSTPRGPIRAFGAWSTSKQGVQDLEGNVWEWTMSCSEKNGDPDRCPAMHVTGAHDAIVSVFVRTPGSGGCAVGTPPTHIGFRLVEDIP